MLINVLRVLLTNFIKKIYKYSNIKIDINRYKINNRINWD